MAVTSNFLNCKVDANLTVDEQKKVVQSVELTKALVLMGYNKWSELEPGKLFIIGNLSYSTILWKLVMCE